jgi:penicillin amidase
MSWKRLGKIAVVVSIILLLVSVGLIAFVLSTVYYSPLPKTSGDEEVIGLEREATVYRDTWGIPHIYADTTEDLLFAQGYIHAQERWWQMELSRLIGQGRVSEIAGKGEDYQNLDRFIRTLGLLEAARDDWETVTPETKAALEAYSSGVNAYIQERSSEDLAAEYSILRLSGKYDTVLALFVQDSEVEPWQPIDSLLWMRLFALNTQGNFWQELARAEQYATLNADLWESYQSIYPYRTHPTILSADELDIPEEIPVVYPAVSPPEISRAEYDAIAGLSLVGEMTEEKLAIIGHHSSPGGNAWVVSGDHTEREKPLLANDLHLPIEIPSQWFEIGLHCNNFTEDCPYNVAGFSVPGVPGVMIGHNDSISWSVNILNADVQDIYVLELNPDNPQQYRFEDEWVNMEMREGEIRVSDELSIEHTTLHTEFGPVISSLAHGNQNQDGSVVPAYALALRWNMLETSGNCIDSLLALNRARNWEEFRSALQVGQWPAMSFLYADTDGNIGYQVTGTLPVRDINHSGLLPVPSVDSRYLWRGTIPFELLPSAYNPADGMIVDANNAPVPLAYYGWLAQQLAEQFPQWGSATELNTFISQEWDAGYRATRIEYLLDAVQKHTLDSFEHVQGDNHNTFAQGFLPYLFALEFEDEELEDMRVWLQEWDLQNHMSSPQAAFFAAIWAAINRLTFADQLGYEPAGMDMDQLLVTIIARDPQQDWWDNRETEPMIETRDDILREAFVTAYEYLQEELGTNRTRWRWGDLHTGTFISRLIGNEDFLNIDPIVDSGPFPINRGPFQMSGGTGIINATTYSPASNPEETPYAVMTLPAYRIIMDLSDFNRSRSIHSTGQSGHIASENYDDMISPSITVNYHDMRWDTSLIIDNSPKRLNLQPD